jgi:hypothetical protein
MKNKFLADSLVASKATFNNLHVTPKLRNIRFEMMAESQSVDQLFGDAMHTLWAAGGSMPSARKASRMKQPSVQLTKTSGASLANWIAKFPVEESQVAYEGADTQAYTVSLDTTRTFLDSKLENDIKYRLGIQEYYVGKAAFRLVFDFNAKSYRQTRAREMLLRMQALPIRLVNRLVG